MRQIRLEEQFVIVSPRSPSQQREDAAVVSPPVLAPAVAVEPAPTVRRTGPLGWLRAIGSAILWTARAVGVVIGIIAAAMSVGVLMVVQRILHLG